MNTELHKTIETLIFFNDQINHKPGAAPVDEDELCAAVDHSISILMQVGNLIKQKGRHNTEIAYLGLKNIARITS